MVLMAISAAYSFMGWFKNLIVYSRSRPQPIRANNRIRRAISHHGAKEVVQIITSDKVKTQAYCDLTKLEGQVKAVDQTTDPKTVEMLTKQAEGLIDKLGPEYFKLMDGLEQVGPNSSEAKEFMSILSELDKRCTK
jgi:hypothetical protein